MKSDNRGILEITRNKFNISKRDIQILQYLADGCYEKDIAVYLGLTHYYVKNLKRAIYDKMGADCAAHAVAIAFRNKLIE